MSNNAALIKKIATAGIMLAIIIIMQLLKNVVPAEASGSVINAVLAIVTINLGIWWGLGFCLLTPITSILVAFASPMTTLTYITFGLNIPIIALGNFIFVFLAKLGHDLYLKYKEQKLWLWTIIFITLIALGAVAKFLFMWGSAKWIIEPIFKDKLDDPTTKVLYALFSLTQLIAGLISVPIVYALTLAIDKFTNNSVNK
ncbi:MAG: ECF transporter S component [Bacilli bacterium]|nr:ECF transporter S component [Bacilli bacterium]